MMTILVVGIGGFIGAVARYLLSGMVQRLHGGAAVVGTMTVNLLGCLLIGAAMGLVEDRPLLGPRVSPFPMVGLLGSFTTFSTFAYQTTEMIRGGQMASALSSATGNVLLGVAAVVLGRTLVKAVGI